MYGEALEQQPGDDKSDNPAGHRGGMGRSVRPESGSDPIAAIAAGGEKLSKALART